MGSTYFIRLEAGLGPKTSVCATVLTWNLMRSSRFLTSLSLSLLSIRHAVCTSRTSRAATDDC
jgi:hypothetical protein